jgi:protein Tex
MTQIQAIARVLRRTEEQLRRPIDLLRQGFDPAFLANYRADETGQLDLLALFRLKRFLDYNDVVARQREEVKVQLTADNLLSTGVGELLDRCESVAEIDRLSRGMRSKKGSRSISTKYPRVAELGQALLTFQGDAPEDLPAWVAQQFSVTIEEATSLLQQTRRWLQLLLQEDAPLMDKLGKHILRKAVVSVEKLKDEKEIDALPESEPAPAATDVSAEIDAAQAAVAQAAPATTDPPATEVVSAGTEQSAEQAETTSSELAAAMPTEVVESVSVQTTDGTPASENVVVDTAAASAAPAEPTLDVKFGDSKKDRQKSGKKKTIVAKSEAKLSPRQRRRRWLRSLLEPFSKLRKPLNRLTSYQVLMLGRGHRSQLLHLKFDYDRGFMVQAARESLSPGRHPLHTWLQSVADEAINVLIAPRLEQEVFAQLEEAAHQELIETAVQHLFLSLSQRPVGRHRVLAIDAIGPKMAAVAIIDENGEVLHTDEIACNSSRHDVVAQNVGLLKECIRQYRVGLVALSNGPARRYLIHTVSQLMKQAPEGSLCWTMVDRAGSEAYCATRLSLQELPSISKRHRAAVWLARRLQDPLRETMKIDPTRLRLGSYQRELPESLLFDGLHQAISATLAAQGIDFWNAPEHVLRRVPGLTNEMVKTLVAIRNSGSVDSRQQIVNALKDASEETRLRQAIGFLRVFGSPEPLDATAIHPEDYRLAQRLTNNTELKVPEAAPPNWVKSTIASAASLEVAPEAAAEGSAEGTTDGEATATEAAADTFAAELHSESSESAELVEAEAPAETESSTDASQATGELAAADASSESAAEGVAAEATDEVAGQASADATAEAVADPVTDALREAVAKLLADASEHKLEPLAIDVEKLARSWQVGREKLKWVANCLQNPFGDSRLAAPPIPLLNTVPTIDNLKPGMSAWAVIVSVVDFGAFADLGPDCSGLIHVSQLSREYTPDPHQTVQVGDLIQVWVLDVDTGKKRISLTAIPPGTVVHRPMEEEHGQSGRDGRPARGDGRGQGRGQQSGRSPQGNRGEQGQQGQQGQQGGRREGGRGDQGRGQGGQPNRGGQQQGRGPGGGGRGGNDRRGGGRNDRRSGDRFVRSDSADTTVTADNQTKPRVPKPVKPITDAMQKGKEPMRSFSDLAQFFHVQRDEPQVEVKNDAQEKSEPQVQSE